MVGTLAPSPLPAFLRAGHIPSFENGGLTPDMTGRFFVMSVGKTKDAAEIEHIAPSNVENKYTDQSRNAFHVSGTSEDDSTRKGCFPFLDKSSENKCKYIA